MNANNQINKINISYYQIFLLTLAQAGGASILYLPGVAEAGRNVWISNIIASIAGYAVIYLHYMPISQSKGSSITDILTNNWGRLIGGLATMYYLYFFFILSNLVVSDVYYFGKITMPETPGYVFIIFLLAPSIYAVKLGIEVIAKFLEFLLPILVIVFFVLFLLVLPKLDFRNLLPIAADGIKPIIGGAIPNMSFPFVDLLPIVFFYQYTKRDTRGRNMFLRATYIAILLATLLLTLRAIGSIAAFEEMTLKTLTFPPFNTIRIIEIGDVLERLDALFLAVFYTTTFYKFTITYYVICKLVSDLSKVGEAKTFAIPIALLIGVSMPFLLPRFETVLSGGITNFYTVLPLLFIIPILLTITIKLRGNKEQDF